MIFPFSVLFRRLILGMYGGFVCGLLNEVWGVGGGGQAVDNIGWLVDAAG